MRTEKTKINLGCGAKKRPHPWVNCDISPYCDPDEIFDFGRDDWPFDDESADEIEALQSLEHSHGLRHVMREAYRVLIPNGRFIIEVPHPRSDFFIGDPTHVMAITQASLDLFSKAWCEDCQANGRSNTPLALMDGVDFRMVENVNELNPRWAKVLLNADGSCKNADQYQHAVATYNNVVWTLRFVLERV